MNEMAQKNEPISKKVYFYAYLTCAFLLLLCILIFFGFSNLAVSFLVNATQTVVLLLVIYWLNLTIDFILHLYDDNQSKIRHFLLFQQAARTIIKLLLFITAFICLLLIWGMTHSKLIEWYDILFVRGFMIGGTPISITFLFKSIITFLTVYYLFKLLNLAVEKLLKQHSSMDVGTRHAITTAIGYIGLLLAIVLSIYSLGLSGTSIAVILSAFTFGISFGLKEIFSDIFSGFIMLIERPVKVGDRIQVNDLPVTVIGDVKKIQLRATIVDTLDKQTLIIPNSKLITSTIYNESVNKITRMNILVQCAYEEDPINVSKVLLGVAKANPAIKANPAPEIQLKDFKGSGIEFVMRAYCYYSDTIRVSSQLRHEIFQAFAKQGIEIPYNKSIVFLPDFDNPIKD
jgi:potassium-dependent mechanosensitive channel